MDYGEFCAEKSCEYYIEWEFNNDTYEQPYRCESCKLVGQSHHVTEYPKNCPYIDEIKVLEGKE